ncbi:MAG TPA: glycosyltransferase [Vicinamibacteria bacterium]|nr:glycosyltransferase [Vicinamibacteria bacterium]
MPRVSVLLPVRDAVSTLPECLESLSSQTLADHEVVAVDDGSTDGSGEILDAAAHRDRRIRVLHTNRCGIAAALNTALAQARASLVARMDADDVAHPERLELQAERLERDPATHVLGCRVRLVGGVGNRGMRAYVEWQNRLTEHAAIERELWVESPLAHPSVAMRTADLGALCGYRDFEGPEDYDLWLRAHAAGLRFAKLPEVLLAWRDSPDRLSRRDPRYGAERFRALKIESLERGPLRGRAAVIWGAGPIGKRWARALLGRGHRVEAFVEVSPRRIGKWIHGAPVVDSAAAGRLRGPLHLAAVGQPGARARIREEAVRVGLEDGVDLLAVA